LSDTSAFDQDLANVGVPQEWITPIKKIGYSTLEDFKKSNSIKLFNELWGMSKKLKLEIPDPLIDDVKRWLGV